MCYALTSLNKTDNRYTTPPKCGVVFYSLKEKHFLDFLQLNKGAALAPMAGATDRVFRAICAEYGAIFTVSEMVSAKALTMKDAKTKMLLQGGGGPAPYAVQLFGSQPEVLAEAVREIEDVPFDFLDLNLGCPAPKIVNNGAGSALLKNPPLAEAFVKAAVQASKRPVTVKMRIGWDDDCMTGLEVAKRCEQAGATMLAVHARTREQQYAPGVNMQAVADIKQAVNIPVLYNGDVTDGTVAKQVLNQTGCDGAMIGRAAMGQPWIFAEIAAAMAGKTPPPPPSLRQRMQVLERQVRGMCDESGEEAAMRQARGVASQYLRGLRGAARLRQVAVALTRFADLESFIEQVYKAQEE